VYDLFYKFIAIRVCSLAVSNRRGKSNELCQLLLIICLDCKAKSVEVESSFREAHLLSPYAL